MTSYSRFEVRIHGKSEVPPSDHVRQLVSTAFSHVDPSFLSQFGLTSVSATCVSTTRDSIVLQVDAKWHNSPDASFSSADEERRLQLHLQSSLTWTCLVPPSHVSTSTHRLLHSQVRRFFSRNRDAAIFAYSLDDASLCIYLFGLLKEESCRFYAARLPNTAYHLPETEERRHHLATIEHESIHHLSFLFDIHPELQHAISQRSAIDGPLQHALICGQPLPADHISRKWYKAAGVMIVRGHHPQQEVGSSLMQQALLLRETRYKNKSKREALGDFINCPGGKRDATDTCAEFTALREFYEESFVEHHLTRDFLVSLWTVLLQCPRLVYFLPDCKYLMFVVAVEDLLDVEQCGLDRLGKDNVPAQPPKETSLLWCSLAELYHAKDAFGTIGQPPAKLFHVLSWLLEGVRPAMMKPI